MYYYPFNKYLREKFGEKVRRLSLNAGFTCPNRDGKLGTEGCVFCNEYGFSRFAGKKISLDEQIVSSMKRAAEKYGVRKFIAYFQNATNTYADVRDLKAAYDVIKNYPEIVGLFISTRPDCAGDEVLDLIAGYIGLYEVWIEYGLQSAHDRTLRGINRGHTFSVTAEAIKRTAERGIKVGAHVILGLPGESREDMIATAKEVSGLPVSGVKLHLLHVLKDTKLEEAYRRGEVELMEREEYVGAACDFLEYTRPDRIVLRLVSDAKEDYLVAPGWMNDKMKVIGAIEDEFSKRGTCQGSALAGVT